MHFDWITFTFQYSEKILNGLPQHDAFLFDDQKPARALPRYERGWRLAGGGLYCVPSAANARNGRIIQFTGKECEQYRNFGLSDRELIVLLMTQKFKPTRIDCAWDTDNPLAKVQDMEDAWDNGKMKTKIRTMFKTTTKGRKGEPANTIYFGHKTSDQRLVVYDKAKQLKLLDKAWTRVEARFYEGAAWRIGRDMALINNDPSEVAAAKVRQMMRSGVAWFEELMAGGDVDLTALEYDKNVWKWLNTQVAPAIDNFTNESEAEKAKMIRWLYHRLNILFPNWTEFK